MYLDCIVIHATYKKIHCTPYCMCPRHLKMVEGAVNIEHIHSLYADVMDCHCGEKYITS